ncbi:hypothetical protein ASZ90_014799 [hydrocarbon metagenome]|uniref:Uncharacterized protein n=1 Tax=hydrocarbon metagenome TaxID=938273 RepID=A0A0W8F4P0_9ZZZZ
MSLAGRGCVEHHPYPETLVLSFPPLSNRGTKGMMHTGDP